MIYCSLNKEIAIAKRVKERNGARISNKKGGSQPPSVRVLTNNTLCFYPLVFVAEMQIRKPTPCSQPGFFTPWSHAETALMTICLYIS